MIEAKLGPLGFLMVMRLRETMAAQTIFLDSPGCEISRKALCKLFGCRDSKLNEFIQLLKDSGQFEIIEVNEVFKFKSLKFAELLNNKAISSQLRNKSGAPDREMDLIDLKDLNKESDIKKNSSLSNPSSFLTTVDFLLTQKGTDILERLPEKYSEYLKKTNTADESLLENITAKIRKQFGSTDKAKILGENIVVKLKTIHTNQKEIVIRNKKVEAENAAKIEKEKSKKLKDQNCPSKTDSECIRVLRMIFNHRSEVISKQAFDSVWTKLVKYWGEQNANMKFINFAEAYDNYYQNAKEFDEPKKVVATKSFKNDKDGASQH
ncbi:MAG: hypothetical protein AABY53_01160 [Bdellovibrionota bacterium]